LNKKTSNEAASLGRARFFLVARLMVQRAK
jgi:hypothetical protein